MAVNLGGACDDGNAATMTDTCRADGTCMGTTGCAIPATACTAGGENRSGCANARTISRVAAGAHITINDSVCSGGNNFTQMCGAVSANGRDHSYRLYMRAGESFAYEARTNSGCSASSWNGVFRIFENGGCTDTACTTQVVCRTAFSFTSGNYPAPRDGWVILVIDGQTISGTSEHGSYRLDITLSCTGGACGC